jgi:hypothetical protein
MDNYNERKKTYMIEKIRKYANAIEMAVQNYEDEERIGGWSDIVMKDTQLLEMVRRMIDNRNNDEGKKIAVLLCKHKKESIQWLADKVMKDEIFEVEDRTSISL